MGLFDGYFDPEQFPESRGLLSRLLALQQQEGQRRPGPNFETASITTSAPSMHPMPSPIVPNYGQPSPDSQIAAANLASQYQSLRPTLGDHKAMIATIHPDIGKTLIAQALANGQEDGNKRRSV